MNPEKSAFDLWSKKTRKQKLPFFILFRHMIIPDL